MKKLFLLLLILLMASSIFAQAQTPPAASTKHQSICDPVIVTGRILTNADDGKSIILHVGEELGVDLPNERHYVSGDECCGLESVSVVSFDASSTEGILNMKTLDLGDSFFLQDNRNFVAAAAGQTTLSYKRILSYVSHGGCPEPMCIESETISFNIIVK